MLRPLVAASLVAAALVTACSGGGGTTGSSSENVTSTTTNLEARTVVKGTLAAGHTVTLDYIPDGYAVDGIPYLALELKGFDDADAGKRSVFVGGDFPGTPQLLLVDESFNVLAEAKGVRNDDGAEAMLAIPAAASTAGKRLLLIQDPKWNAPMEFDVSAE